MDLYNTFIALNIDTSLIGLEQGSKESDYFCTPIGAEIIGWDSCGIHYCFIKGLGQTVFAVNPNGMTDSFGNDFFVYPLAEDFEVFLRLILSAKHTAALEQIIWFTKTHFIAFMNSSDNAVLAEQQDVLDTLCQKLSLAKLENPYDYVKQLQTQFDYSCIPFSDDYYDLRGIDCPNTCI